MDEFLTITTTYGGKKGNNIKGMSQQYFRKGASSFAFVIRIVRM